MSGCTLEGVSGVSRAAVTVTEFYIPVALKKYYPSSKGNHSGHCDLHESCWKFILNELREDFCILDSLISRLS
jgi:hypothetical protein